MAQVGASSRTAVMVAFAHPSPSGIRAPTSGSGRAFLHVKPTEWPAVLGIYEPDGFYCLRLRHCAVTPPSMTSSEPVT